MPEAVVDIDGRGLPLQIRINGDDPTFRLKPDTVRAKAVSELDPVLLDLLEIAATVFAADGSQTRGGDARQRMGRDWRRRFAFTIPVRRPDLWSRPDVVLALTEAIEFLTEDHVEFHFTQADPEPVAQPFLDLDPTGTVFLADEVILFSGGLDSFAGALEVLASPSARVILVSHRSAQKVIPRQQKLGAYLADRFAGRVLHLQVEARRAGPEAIDTTQRSRTFLFAALGQLAAQTFGAKRVNFFENGVVSHNLPLSRQIVGSMATRTTHPLALNKLDRLMRLIGPAAVPTENRYQWLTKTEVIGRIVEHHAVDQIPVAVSCTTVREQTTLHTHCGTCSQCLDRRFAILAAGLEAHDFPESYATDVLFGERDSVASKTMALEWTRHALRLGDFDEAGFMETFGLELSRILSGLTNLPRQSAFTQVLDMHRRHSRAVRKVLKDVIGDRLDDIVSQRIPPSSLVAMHLGQVSGPEASLPADPRSAVPRSDPIGDPEEVDTVPSPEAPLRVTFVEMDRDQLVIVEGLGRVTGPAARIPHALKPAFEEDRCRGLNPSSHRFLEPTLLPGLNGMSKDLIRQNVRRCRQTLAASFEQLHGVPPKADLLIQGQRPKGYRLDPHIEIAPAVDER